MPIDIPDKYLPLIEAHRRARSSINPVTNAHKDAVLGRLIKTLQNFQAGKVDRKPFFHIMLTQYLIEVDFLGSQNRYSTTRGFCQKILNDFLNNRLEEDSSFASMETWFRELLVSHYFYENLRNPRAPCVKALGNYLFDKETGWVHLLARQYLNAGSLTQRQALHDWLERTPRLFFQTDMAKRPLEAAKFIREQGGFFARTRSQAAVIPTDSTSGEKVRSNQIRAPIEYRSRR